MRFLFIFSKEMRKKWHGVNFHKKGYNRKLYNWKF